MFTGGEDPACRGRVSECALLDELVASVRSGTGRSLVLRGEAGIGKTTLLNYLEASASGLTVLRAAGVDSEMELAYASLHQLCLPLLDGLERLPAPQREALRTVFGLSAGPPPDRFLVGLAVLSLLSEAAESRPLLCVVDDAQWLDTASVQTLVFVARRLLAEPVGIVFAAREPCAELEHIAGLDVRGLGDGDARTVLDSAVPFKIDERVRDQIIAETRGNPLALLELPRGLTATQLAGGFGLMGAQGLRGRIEESFVRRLGALSDDVRRLLLLAAAEPLGDPLLLRRAAAQLEISVAAVDTETDGLLVVDDRVVFRHPLVRSAVYRSASVHERRTAHLALAEATDQEADPDRRAWHLAAAAAGPNEEVALELERSAGRAQARGGFAAAAAFLQRSLALTSDPALRAKRALAAAEASLHAGAFDAADRLLSTAEAGNPNDVQRARVDLIRARIAFGVNRGSNAPPLLLKAAKQLAALDPLLSRDTYLEALFASVFAGRFGSDGGVLSVAQAVHAAPPAPDPPRAADLLLDRYALLITEGYAVGAPALKAAVETFRSGDIPADEVLRWGFLVSSAALALLDVKSYHELAAREAALAREVGALAVLPLSLTHLVGAHLELGELDVAESLLRDIEIVCEATGRAVPSYAALAYASWRGQEPEYEELKKVHMDAAVKRGEGLAVTHLEWKTAVHYVGLGKYEEAVTVALSANQHPEELQSVWLHNLVEAAVRSGRRQLAAETLEQLSAMTRVIGSEWALGIEARCRALLSENDAAEDLYLAAIVHLERSGVRVELARARLLYGEWLRRAGRRVDARTQLRAAYDELTAMGVEAFAQRARRELVATGEKIRKRTVETRDDLTPQERQIAELARERLSSSEIAARLFLSPRTVDWHLSKVYAKLGIGSRKELADALPRGRHPAAPDASDAPALFPAGAPAV